MLSAHDSELITRVGPGTPMGDLMREYWIPCAKSSEVESDHPPMRLRLLGENLIAFRDASGRVGIMDHRCPHRCASLFFGRNEAQGVRCAYHGWQFDVDGNCIDMPNVPPHQDFKEKVRAKAYKVIERNGLIWTYMGNRENPPAFSMIEALQLPEAEINIIVTQRNCNWLQALEGDIDTSHFGFLHMGGVDADKADTDNLGYYSVTDRAPEYEVSETDWGTMYGTYRPAEKGSTYWRFAQFLFPFWTMPPNGLFRDHVTARAWVPMDDTHTMWILVRWKDASGGLSMQRDGNRIPGTKPGSNYLPNGTGWYGRWRLSENDENDYMIDREAQRSGENYTGIEGIGLQDQAITESMGAILDHSFEHLAPSDLMITQTRRRLINAATALRDNGDTPPGVDDPEVYRGATSGDFLAPDGKNWLEAYADELKNCTNPAQSLKLRLPDAAE